MAKRELKPLTSPEAFGLFVNLLARYANDVPDKTDIERKLEVRLGDDPRTRAVAGRLVKNFKEIPAEQRIKELGDLAEPNLSRFPDERLTAAFKNIPTPSGSPVLLADDVDLEPLPPLNPEERITLQYSGIFCSEETG